MKRLISPLAFGLIGAAIYAVGSPLLYAQLNRPITPDGVGQFQYVPIYLPDARGERQSLLLVCDTQDRNNIRMLDLNKIKGVSYTSKPLQPLPWVIFDK
jgi:hypothetical protein